MKFVHKLAANSWTVFCRIYVNMYNERIIPILEGDIIFAENFDSKKTKFHREDYLGNYGRDWCKIRVDYVDA